MLKIKRLFRLSRIYEKLRTKQKWMKVSDVKSWALRETMPVKKIDINQDTFIHKPNILENLKTLSPFAYGEAKLPEVYCAELANVCVVGDSDLLISQDHTALYDEIALDKEGNFELRRGMAPLIKQRDLKNEKILLQFKKCKKKLPDRAIHFCKDYSYNYFHWLIECLPRMWVIENCNEYDSLPLLVDDGLQLQQFESLKLIANRPIIRLKPGNAYRINKLIYPSSLSSVHEILSYSNPLQYDRDVVISPLAIQYLRNKYLPLLDKDPNNQSNYDKIFISRKKLTNQKHRLINTLMLEEKLSSMGFAIVHPESLSFLDQVRLFANAKVIVGAAGSAFANIAFVQKSCKVFMLCIQQGLNPYVFGGIASIVGCNLYHIVDHASNRQDVFDVHSLFVIDPEYLVSVLGSN